MRNCGCHESKEHIWIGQDTDRRIIGGYNKILFVKVVF
jgi:hypothetical protein